MAQYGATSHNRKGGRGRARKRGSSGAKTSAGLCRHASDARCIVAQQSESNANGRCESAGAGASIAELLQPAHAT
eukprot:12219786-Alexandrium_andersonii.AAC.1